MAALSLVTVGACRPEAPPSTEDSTYGYIDLAELAQPTRPMPVEAEAHDVVRLAFRFDEEGQVQRWRGAGGLEPPRVADGALRTRVTGRDASLARHLRDFDTTGVTLARVEMSVEHGREAEILWRGSGRGPSEPWREQAFRLTPDGSFHTYQVRLSEGVAPLPFQRGSDDWRGAIDALRLNLPPRAGEVAIRRIELVAGPSHDEQIAELVRSGAVDHVRLGAVSRRILPAGAGPSPVRIPRGSSLATAIGVLAWGWEGEPGSCFEFRIRFVPDGGRSAVLWSRTLCRQTTSDDGSWVPVRLSLDEVAGQHGRLVFDAGPVSGDAGEWKGTVWAAPVLRFDAAARADRPPRPANLVLVSIDTLRADDLGCYGSPRITSPFLDRRLARAGAQLARAYAPAPWTLPSHTTLFTGLFAPHHGVQTGFDRLGPELVTLAEVLKQAGYRTAAVTGGANLAPEWGFDQGFDDYAVVPELNPALASVTSKLEELRPGPFFLFFHSQEPHAPYDVRSPYFALFHGAPYAGSYHGTTDELLSVNRGDTVPSPDDLDYLRAMYESEIAWTDQAIGRLLARLERLEPTSDTVVALVSDHGEEFHEHGGMEHGRSLHEELLRVPALIRQPGRIRGGLVVAEPTSLADVSPTLLDLVGARHPTSLDGVSLAARLLGGPPILERPLIESVVHGFYGEPKYAVIVGTEKIIARPDSSSEELYHLDRDPGEMAPQPPEDAAPLLRAVLDEVVSSAGAGPATTSTVPGLSRETREQLRALGYAD